MMTKYERYKKSRNEIDNLKAQGRRPEAWMLVDQLLDSLAPPPPKQEQKNGRKTSKPKLRTGANRA